MTTTPIQLFSPSFRVEECLTEIRQCLDLGWTGLGFKTVEFENAWKSYSGLPNAHFINSATSGLHLALHVLKSRYGWADDDEVISTPLTFVSTNHAILYERLMPVFADVDSSLCLDPRKVEQKITPRTRAIIYVGIGGNAGQLGPMIELAKSYNLKLILDAAHMAGTKYLGRHVGFGADVAVFSFQAVKNLPTADSGMICWDDPEDDKQTRKLTWLGINKDTFARTSAKGDYKWMYDVEDVGFKYHGNSIMAAIGLVQLKYLDEDNKVRRSLAQKYRNALGSIDGIEIVNESADCVSSTHLCQIIIKMRDELMVYLNNHNIFPGVHYRSNSAYSMYKNMDLCPNAERIASSILSLPLHLRLTDEMQINVIERIRDFARSKPIEKINELV